MENVRKRKEYFIEFYRENCFCQILDLKEDEDDRHSGGTLKRTFLQRIKYIYI